MSGRKPEKGRAVEGEGNVFPIAIPPFDVGAPRIWVTDLDELVLGLRTLESAPDIALVARILRPDGQVDSLSTRETPTVTNNVASMRFPLSDGWLISVAVHEQTQWITGRTYGVLSVGPLNDTSQFDRLILAQGYFTNLTRLYWPGFPSHGSLSGPGVLVVTSPVNPGAGNSLDISVPTLMRWRLLSVFATFTNDGSGSPLEPRVDIFRSGGRIARAQAGNTVALTTAAITTAFIGASDNQPTATLLQFPLFDLLLSEGDVIRVTAGFLGAGDTITDAELISEQWFEEQS